MLRPAPTCVGLEEADLAEYTLARQEALLRAREAQQALLQQHKAPHHTPAWGPPKATALTAAQRIGLAPPGAPASGAGAGGR